jgi:TolB-like protein
MWAAVAAVAALAALLALAWNSVRSGDRIESLAVLPFTSDQGASLDYLADGLTEGLINSLSQLRPLRVMARSTVFAYKDRAISPREAGQAIGVRAVLAGRVARRGRDLVVSIELVDTRDGAQLWAARYAFELGELNAAPVRLAFEVAAALSVKPRGVDFARASTRDPRAYDAYLRGRWHWNQRTSAGYQKAIEYFEQASAVDPGYALAYAGLADAYGLLGWQSAPPRAYLPKARAMALRALSLDDRLAEGHTSLGMIKALYDWDWQGAEAEFRRAIELNPGYATAHHWLAVHLNGQGRHDEARAEFAQALALDPLSRIINANAGYPDHYQGRIEAAIVAYRKALDLDPGFATAHEDLSLALEQSGREAEAAAEVVRYLKAAGEPSLAERFERVSRERGYKPALQAWLDEVLRRANAAYVSPLQIAQLYLRTGNAPKALEWLERACDERSAGLVYLKTDPQYAPLRSDPRFPSLLARVGL